MFGNRELEVWKEPFNKPKACVSRANLGVYNIPVNDLGINMLTNKKSVKNEYGFEICEFSIKEIEVWGITFKN